MKFNLQTTRKITFFAFCLGVCLFNPQTAFSQKTWDGGGGAASNVWADAANWNGDVVPLNTEEVIIPEGVTVRVSANATCRKLQIGGSTDKQSKLIVDPGVTFSVNATDVAAVGGVGNAAVILFGGIIENNGIMTVLGRQSIDAMRFDEPKGGSVSSTYTGAGTLTCNTSNSTGGGGSATTGCCVTFAQTSGTATFTLSSTGLYTFNTGGTLTQGTPTPFPTSKSVFYAAKGNAVINGSGSISISGDRRPVRVIPVSGATATLTIESGVTMQLASTMGNGNTGMVSVENVFADASSNLINKGTLNFSGAKGNAIGLSNGPSTTSPSTFVNEGTININGDFTDATLNVTLGGIFFGGQGIVNGSNFTNASKGIINYNTLVTGTSVKPLFVTTVSTSPKYTITNKGTITVGTNGALTNAIRLGDSKTVFNNEGTITIGKGNIANTIGLGLGTGTNAVFNNNTGGILNFTAASSATDSVTFNNAGGTLGGSVTFSNVGGNTFTAASIISPGQGTGAGIVTFNDASLTLNGTFNANINGKATAGTDFDQIAAPNAAVDVTGLTIVATTGFTAAANDAVTLINAKSITGTPKFTLPRGWTGSVAGGQIKITASASVGTREITEGVISMSPNPTSDVVRITLSESIRPELTSIAVHDLVGRLVWAQKATANTMIVDMSSLTKGVYFVKVSVNNSVYTEKIIKQ